MAACFATISCDSSLSEYSDGYEGMNIQLDLEMEQHYSWGKRWGIRRRPRLKRQKIESSGNGASVSVGVLHWKTGEGLGYFTEALRMYKVCSETGISIRVPLRTWTVGRLSGSVRDERVLWTRGFLSNGFLRVKPGGGTLTGTLKFMSMKDL